MNTVFLRLEAPLQAWGLRARWEERDTADEPTKSGVIGIIGCALGLHRADSRLAELNQALRMGVRVDREGTRLSDYHTTGGGFYQDAGYRGGSWFHSDPYIGGVLSAEQKDGKIKVKFTGTTGEPETDVSYRHYLMDASFLVVLHGSDDVIAEVATALQTPVFPVFLGRKACVPSLPVFAGVGAYADVATALQDVENYPVHHLKPQPSLRLVIEDTTGRRQRDVLHTAQQRVFRWRYVREDYFMLTQTNDSATSNPDALNLNTLEG